MSDKIPKVILMGRPNVGKSSLFNALLGYRRAIVLDLPGTTHDFLKETVTWEGKEYSLWDMQGIFGDENAEELEKALAQADICLFVVDGKEGINPFDRFLAAKIHQSGLPTLLVLNKCDVASSDELEFAELGFENILSVSSSHRRNLADLEDWVVKTAANALAPSETPDFKLAIVGRPNAGKSTLMNRLSKEEISKVSPIAHTTRDSISHVVRHENILINLVDTAGIRKKVDRESDIERFSVQSAKRALRDCDVVLLLINASEPLVEQDLKLISLVAEEGRPAVIAYNCWDKVEARERRFFLKNMRLHPLIQKNNAIPISALHGENVRKMMELVVETYQKSRERIPTSQLNRVMKTLVEKNPPPSAGRGNFNILYTSQVKVQPPTFVIFLNRKDSLPKSYQTYLTNGLRKHFDFSGQAIRLEFRGSEKKDRRPAPPSRH